MISALLQAAAKSKRELLSIFKHLGKLQVSDYKQLLFCHAPCLSRASHK